MPDLLLKHVNVLFPIFLIPCVDFEGKYTEILLLAQKQSSFRKANMEKEIVDLRDLILMIKEQKQMNANLALEFDCVIEADDVKPLIKVINYAINYISRLTDQQQQISLNASMSGITISFTAFTTSSDLPAINPQVNEALAPYNAVMEQKGEPGKYTQLLISFRK